jgi:hypothetical protein
MTRAPSPGPPLPAPPPPAPPPPALPLPALPLPALPLPALPLPALLLAALLALPGQGCFISPSDDGELARIALSLDMPAAGALAAGQTSSPFDNQDLFHLDVFPKFVRVAVEVEDYELTSGTWPDPERGGVGEGDEGEVDVALQVPAGEGRRITVLAYIHELERVIPYRQQKPATVDLVAGTTTDLTLEMVRHETGKVAASVRCQQGNTGLWQPERISIVDARAMVVFPKEKLETDIYTQALKTEVAGVPVNRAFWARIYLKHLVTGETDFMDVRLPTFQVKTANDTSPVNLSIPCYLLK